MSLWMILAGAATGAALGEVRGQRAKAADERRRKREKRRESGIALWSPWSGMQGQRVSEQRVDPTDSALQGGITGAQMGQNLWYADSMLSGGGEGAAPAVSQEAVAGDYSPPPGSVPGYEPAGTYGIQHQGQLVTQPGPVEGDPAFNMPGPNIPQGPKSGLSPNPQAGPWFQPGVTQKPAYGYYNPQPAY